MRWIAKLNEVSAGTVENSRRRLFGEKSQQLFAIGFAEAGWFSEELFPFSVIVLPLLVLPYWFGEKAILTPLLSVKSIYPRFLSPDAQTWASISLKSIAFRSFSLDGFLLVTSTRSINKDGSPYVKSTNYTFRQYVAGTAPSALEAHLKKKAELEGIGKRFRTVQPAQDAAEAYQLELKATKKEFLLAFKMHFVIIALIAAAVCHNLLAAP